MTLTDKTGCNNEIQAQNFHSYGYVCSDVEWGAWLGSQSLSLVRVPVGPMTKPN